MVIDQINPDGTGYVDLDGTRYHVNLSLIDDAARGDYVIVHAGFAIEKLDRDEADQRLELFAELAATRQTKDVRP